MSMMKIVFLIATATATATTSAAAPPTSFCDPANCGGWECADWCSCFNQALEPEYTQHGCIDDGSDACKCDEYASAQTQIAADDDLIVAETEELDCSGTYASSDTEQCAADLVEAYSESVNATVFVTCTPSSKSAALTCASDGNRRRRLSAGGAMSVTTIFEADEGESVKSLLAIIKTTQSKRPRGWKTTRQASPKKRSKWLLSAPQAQKNMLQKLQNAKAPRLPKSSYWTKCNKKCSKKKGKEYKLSGLKRGGKVPGTKYSKKMKRCKSGKHNECKLKPTLSPTDSPTLSPTDVPTDAPPPWRL